jgi:DNA-binding NarL/FixJ family response regulator
MGRSTEEARGYRTAEAYRTVETRSGGLNGSDERIRVLVIGESPIVRAGLAAAISESDRFEVAGICNIAGSAALFESTAASAVLMESSTFSSWMPDDSVSESGPDPKPPSGVLTPREIEVLRLMADGASNKIIAHKLGISDHTAKFHVTSILSKLNAGSRTEAVTLGVRKGLVYL